MNGKLWRTVQRFCHGSDFDPEAFEAFAQIVEEEGENDVRQGVTGWNDAKLERLSLLMSGTLDTVDHPRKAGGVLQCQGLYVTGAEGSLRLLGGREIPPEVRSEMAELLDESLQDQTQLIVGSHVVPVTWVHSFTWKQWRAALSRHGAMFSPPGRVQPKQATEAQGWILPIFFDKDDIQTDLEADVAAAGISGLGLRLAESLARYFRRVPGGLPDDVSIHPVMAAAHSCWMHAKMIATHDWARRIQTRAQASGLQLRFEEAPQRGSVQVKNMSSGELVAALEADASFPVDGTGMVLQLITQGPVST